MHIERLDPAAFGSRAGAFLLEGEAEHSVMLGLVSRLSLDPLFYGHEPYLAAAVDEGQVVGAALRTPPHGVLLARTDDRAAVDALAGDLHELYGELPGVIAAAETAEWFVERWQTLTGTRGRIAVAEAAFQASLVVYPVGVSGVSRPYREDDWDLALAWFNAFEEEALPEPTPIDATVQLTKRLGDPDSGLVLWEDAGRVVSLAGYTGRTPNGIRIGPVYTPPDLRGRGYASALVADVTASLLAGGRAFCFLFTDLANPTSNSIYQRVGYERVADVNWWVFDG